MADYFPPADSKGGWREAKRGGAARKKAGLDIRVLDDAFEFIKGSTKNGGLAVVRRGYLAYEKYFGQGQREAAPNQGSCGKSYTSIACGVLMEEFPELFPLGLDQPVYRTTHLPPKAFPLSDKRKADIKLGELLAFSAGIRGNNPCWVNGEETTIDPVGPDGWQGMEDDRALGVMDDTFSDGRPFTTKTLWCDPGGGYSYATASIHIVSIMIRHIAEMEMEEYLRTRVGNRVGWERWSFGYKSTPARAHTPGGGGIAMRSTDVLRFLYMLLHRGEWDGEQVVPEWYVDACSKASPYNPHFPYSLQFNVSAGHIPNVPSDAYWKAGSGGHAIYVIPSLDMVVWKLGGRDEQFREANTGLKEPKPTRDDREGWEKAVDDSAALTRLLEMVCGAVVDG